MMGSLVLTQFTSPVLFAITARTWLRILCLNIAFNGAIHYGIGAALHEIATLDYLRASSTRQILYSFVPGIAAFGTTYWMLLSSPLTVSTLWAGFAALSLIQTVSMLNDQKYVRREFLPVWYGRIRKYTFAYLLVLTSVLFAVMFSNIDMVQKKNSNDRIKMLNELMDMDDKEFLETVRV